MDRHRALRKLVAFFALATLTSSCALGSSPAGEASTTASSATQPGSTASTDNASSTPGSDSSEQDTQTVPVPGSLLEAIKNNPDLSKFRQAIDKAQLQQEFQKAAPRTVFAPINSAFDQLSPEQAKALEQDPQLLAQILRHHLIPNALSSGELGENHISLATHPILIGVGPSGETVVSGGAGSGIVQRSDLRSTNGVIHILDQVMWPPKHNLVQALTQSGTFNKLLEIIKASGFQPELETTKNYTFLAPSDDAFKGLAARMGQANFDAMMKDPAQLRALLLPHLHAGVRCQNSIGAEEDLQSLDPEKPLRFRMRKDPWVTFLVNGREILGAQETMTTNGLIIEVGGTLHDGP